MPNRSLTSCFWDFALTPTLNLTCCPSIDGSLPALYKSGARITGFDGRENEFLFLSREYDYFWHRSSSSALLESFSEFLLLIKPDVVHFHHFLTYGVDLLTLTRRILPEVRIIFYLARVSGDLRRGRPHAADR